MHPKTVELQARTRKFAAAVITFCDGLSKDTATQRIVLQLIDSSGSTDSNYRAACRARSKAEFIAKLGVAIEEADESKGWLQLLVASNRVSIDEARDLDSGIGRTDLYLREVTHHGRAPKTRARSRGKGARREATSEVAIANLQSVDLQSAIFNPSIGNLQSAICN